MTLIVAFVDGLGLAQSGVGSPSLREHVRDLGGVPTWLGNWDSFRLIESLGEKLSIAVEGDKTVVVAHSFGASAFGRWIWTAPRLPDGVVLIDPVAEDWRSPGAFPPSIPLLWLQRSQIIGPPRQEITQNGLNLHPTIYPGGHNDLSSQFIFASLDNFLKEVIADAGPNIRSHAPVSP